MHTRSTGGGAHGQGGPLMQHGPGARFALAASPARGGGRGDGGQPRGAAPPRRLVDLGHAPRLRPASPGSVMLPPMLHPSCRRALACPQHPPAHLSPLLHPPSSHSASPHSPPASSPAERWRPRPTSPLPPTPPTGTWWWRWVHAFEGRRGSRRQPRRPQPSRVPLGRAPYTPPPRRPLPQAIKALKERSGSSRPAIAKYIGMPGGQCGAGDLVWPARGAARQTLPSRGCWNGGEGGGQAGGSQAGPPCRPLRLRAARVDPPRPCPPPDPAGPC